MDTVEVIAIQVVFGCLGGALWGLIPFLIGKFLHKPRLANLALLCCALSGILGVAFIPCIGFTIVIIARKTDYWPGASSRSQYTQPTTNAAVSVYPSRASVTCLSGPFKGRVYALGPDGLLFGQNPECGVCFPAGTPGVSRRHCMLQQNGGQVVLTDMGSSYGTFLSNGTKLPPQYPTQLSSGSRFYLATTACMFQVNI